MYHAALLEQSKTETKWNHRVLLICRCLPFGWCARSVLFSALHPRETCKTRDLCAWCCFHNILGHKRWSHPSFPNKGEKHKTKVPSTMHVQMEKFRWMTTGIVTHFGPHPLRWPFETHGEISLLLSRWTMAILKSQKRSWCLCILNLSFQCYISWTKHRWAVQFVLQNEIKIVGTIELFNTHLYICHSCSNESFSQIHVNLSHKIGHDKFTTVPITVIMSISECSSYSIGPHKSLNILNLCIARSA